MTEAEEQLIKAALACWEDHDSQDDGGWDTLLLNDIWDACAAVRAEREEQRRREVKALKSLAELKARWLPITRVGGLTD
jgi:hypothetical protein